jgi:AraC-like DNA-binding protein
MINKIVPGLDLFVAAQGFLLFLIIMAFSSERRRANVLLAFTILALAFARLVGHLIYSGISTLPSIELLGAGRVAVGPLLYFYICVLIIKDFQFNKWHGLHIVSAVALLGIFKFFDIESLPSTPDHWSARDHRVEVILSLVTWLYLIAYLIACRYKVRAYNQSIRDNYSSVDKITLNWLGAVISILLATSSFLIVIKLLNFVAYFHWVSLHIDLSFLGELLVACLDGLFFYVVAVSCIRQRNIFESQRNETATVSSETTTHENKPSIEPQSKPKYGHSALEPELAQSIWSEVERYMRGGQPFLDCDLQLAQIADAVGVSTYDLSQVINTIAGINFYDFINGYRAQKAKEIIEERAGSTLAMNDIALEAGFASKATFYRHFKKHFDITPAQYKKNCITP